MPDFLDLLLPLEPAHLFESGRDDPLPELPIDDQPAQALCGRGRKWWREQAVLAVTQQARSWPD